MSGWSVTRRASLALLLAVTAAACGEDPGATADASSVAGDVAPAAAQGDAVSTAEQDRRLYAQGVTWDTFLAGVEERVDLWRELAARGELPDALVTRARAAAEGSDWRLLIVAEDGCSDSASTIPYVARLAAAAGVDLRVVDAAAGRPVMERHRTPDGRAATPTVVLLDADFDEIGCWVERPAALQAWYTANRDGLGAGALADQKAGWYRGDRGRDTLAEIVAMLEGAGAVRC